MARWARPFANPARYKCVYGGRVSGKTRGFSRLLIAIGSMQKRRIIVCRDHATNTRLTAKIALENEIIEMGLKHIWAFYRYRLYCYATGTSIEFAGIEYDPDKIRGWEDVDIVWVEEAQKITERAARVLIPTIRKPGSELWFSWNPKKRSDWVWQRFVVNPRPDDVIAKVNWRDNPWLPAASEAERLADLKADPDLYLHIWEGEPDDEGEAARVLPYRMVAACVEAYSEGLHRGASGPTHIGLDVGDAGYSALACRRGPVVDGVERFRSAVIGVTARRADRYAQAENADMLVYDAGGMGAGVRSYLVEMGSLPYVMRPEMFGGKVAGENVLYAYRYTNRDFFYARNAQLAWNLRLRAQRTQRLLSGDDVDPARCLFINPAIRELEELKTQLAQPTYREVTNGRIRLDKFGEDAGLSPDMFDAVCLAFARDSLYGLRARD